jgi:hypothetical protein
MLESDRHFLALFSFHTVILASITAHVLNVNRP